MKYIKFFNESVQNTSLEIEVLKKLFELVDGDHEDWLSDEGFQQQLEIIDSKLYQLGDIIINRSDSEFKASEILEELIFYYDVHFYTENKILDQFLNVHDSDLHKEEHRKFYNELLNLRNKDFISVDIYKKIKNWSDNHIKIMDSKILEKLYETPKEVNKNL